MKVIIQFVSGARAGQRVELVDRPLIRLGRRPGNDVQFDVNRDLDVSGHHAEIRQEPDGCYLYDVGSANGTYAGGVRIERLRLRDAQEISFGVEGPRVMINLPAEPPRPGAVPAGQSAPSGGPPPSPVPVEAAQAGPAAAPAAGVYPGSSSPQVASAVQSAGGAQQQPASAGQQAAASLAAGGRVGARTVGMMIDSALQRAREGSSGSMGKSTLFMRSMVNQAVTRSTRRFKLVTIALGVLLVGAVAGFLVLRHFERRESEQSQDALRRQMAGLMQRMGKRANISAEEKKRLIAQLKTLNRKLASRTPLAAGKAIVQRDQQAIFLMGFSAPSGQRRGFCTAFAIKKRLLATNTHCLLALERLRSTGLSVFLVMNRHPEKRYEIARWVRHPRYHKPGKAISEDVGLVFVDRDLPAHVQLATDEDLRELESGDVMYTYGFPGRLARVSSPEATIVQGVIGRMTKLNGDHGDHGDTKLIQHSAYTSGGTSGSPIFSRQGKVIAINAGGYVEAGTMNVMDPSTGRAAKVRVAKHLAGYNFGIRIDVLRGLMRQSGL